MAGALAKDRLAGFSELGQRGPRRKYDAETDRRILALLDTPPPEGSANWTGPLLAKALGDVSVQYVWRFLHAWAIHAIRCNTKLGDLGGQIAINYLILNGSGGALRPFPTTSRHTLSAPIMHLNSEKLVITPKMRCDCGGKGLVI